MEKDTVESPLNLLASQRRQSILDLLQEEGSARVSALSRIFGVSEPTIRQDLEKLESEGWILREHGGAFLRSVPEQVKSLSLQHLENMEKKIRIGRRAAEFVSDGDSLILDSGSTTTEIAKNLASRKNLTIITNALNIALLLGTTVSCEIMVTGGDFKAPTLSLTGEKSARFFDHIHVSKLFLAAGGIGAATGLSYPGMADLTVKQAMINAASKIYLVADSTKIGKISFVSLGGIELVHVLVTDDGIRDEDRGLFEARGVEVVIA